MSTSTVRRDVQFDLIPPDGPAVPVNVELVYEPADPYAIQVRFATGPVWILGRELLGRGLLERTGKGDVCLAPLPHRPGYVQLVLMSPYGWAVFAVETDCLQEFLTCTYARVPAGAEMAQVDLDAELAALLEGGFPESGRSAR